MMGKAQSSIEFVALFGVALAFFILLYLYLANDRLLTAEGYGALEARSLARQVASILTSAGVSQGFYYEFSLPALVGGKQYNLTIANDSVWIDWARGSFVAEARPGTVRNSTSQAPFRLGPGNYFANNTAGTVWMVAR